MAQSIENLIGEPAEDVLRISAKTGQGVHELLEKIVERVPAPSGDPDAPLKALIFDSVFDTYRGSIVYARVFDGSLEKREGIKFMATGAEVDAEEIGFLRMSMQPTAKLSAGEVGYIIGSIKDVKETQVGDTVTTQANPASDPIAGFREAKPMVFSGVYPTNADEFEDLRTSLEKLQLNDAALTFEPETSAALGFRVSSWIPGSAAHGDRPGAARSRIRPGHHHDGTERKVSRVENRQIGDHGRESV